MPAYFITGSPDAGKSSVVRRSDDRDRAVCGTDSMPGSISQLQLRATGKPADAWPADLIVRDMFAWNWQPAAIDAVQPLEKVVDGILFYVCNYH